MRKYTEQELRAEFEKLHSFQPLARWGGVGDYIAALVQAYWLGFKTAARFLGALSGAHKGETDK